MNNGIDRCYENLANAIVIQAVNDYQRALKRLKKFPDSPIEKRVIVECERFFTSEYYKKLTDVGPKLIMAEIHRRVEDDKRESRKISNHLRRA